MPWPGVVCRAPALETGFPDHPGVFVTSFTTRHRIAIAAILALACVVTLILSRNGTLDPVRTGLRQALSPLSSATNSIIRQNRSDSDLERENAQLQQERDDLASQVARLHDLEKEVEQLRQLVNVQETNTDWTMVTARVIASDPAMLNKTITIDKGSADGIEKGMAVVDPYFFVGLVTAVSEHSAQVTLGIDITSSVGADDQNTGATGIVYGLWQNGGRMEMRHIDRASSVAKGDLIVTSNDSSVNTAMVPGNIIIGKVTEDPVTDNQSDTLTVTVAPASNYDNLEVVAVITDSTRPTNASAAGTPTAAPATPSPAS
jgi:rod shape-determining protein MreC